MAASVSDAANLDGEVLDGDDCAGADGPEREESAFRGETVRNLSDALCAGDLGSGDLGMRDLDLSRPNATLTTAFQCNASAVIEVLPTVTAAHRKTPRGGARRFVSTTR
jgi:hypothetical protein